ncbi:MAG: hypothetical protein JW940_16985 [Polyangiaceae bacterium]|nr:hypothetical protein [Polyangiaceae bacterium]
MESSSHDTVVDARTDAQHKHTIVIRRKSLVIAFLVSVACIAVAYGVGRLQGAVHISDLEAKAAEATKQSESKARTLQTDLAASRQKLLQLEASRQLYLSLVALDQRNFGIAQEHIQKSSKFLVRSGPPAGGALAQLAKAMLESNLVATENISTQRDQVLRWATALVALVPPPAS